MNEIHYIHAAMPTEFEMKPLDAAIYGITDHKGGGGIFKAVLSVAIAIAIPVAAPALVGALSTGVLAGTALGAAISGGVGFAIASGVTGAALGALGSAITGQDVKSGAISGALSGGVAGFLKAPPTGGAEAATSAPGAVSGASSVPVSDASGAVGLGDAATAADINALTAASPTGLPANANAVGGVGTSAGEVLSGAAGGVPVEARTAADAVAGVNTGGSVAGGATGAGGGGTIFDKVGDFTGVNPETLREGAIKLGANQIGQQIANATVGTGPEADIRQQQLAELRRIRNQNQRVFDRRFEFSDDLARQANQFDPTQFGLQQANDQRIRDAIAIRQQQRGLSLGGRSRDAIDAERRRGVLQSSRNFGSAFDQGFNTGLNQRRSTTNAAVSALPSGANTSGFSSGNTLLGTYSGLEDRRREAANRFSDTIGDLFRKNEMENEEDEVEARLART